MKTILFLATLLAFNGAVFAGEGYAGAVQVKPLVRTDTTAAGQPIAYPDTTQPEVSIVEVTIPPGTETGWHRHPFPIYGVLLTGSLSVNMEGGKSAHYRAGDAIVEVVNLWHNGRNTGDEPAKLIMVVTGEKSKPFTTKNP